jgi:hypothetical protein
MNRKKLIFLLVSLAAVILLAVFAVKLMNKKGNSITELIEFNIQDTSAVDKVIITDAFGNKMEILRNGKRWEEVNGTCITQTNVQFILEAFKNVEFKGYLPDNSHKQFLKLMAAQSTKVEIYQEGDWVKTWYIGPPAQDHYGQIMLLDDAELGKSDIPVMMKIKGMQGIIEPRFFADKRKWMCTNIFSLTIDKIAKVDVRFYDEPSRSFTVTKKKTKLDVYQQGKKLPSIDTAMIFRYLQNYKKIHFDNPNYELKPQQIDSVKRSQPFVVLSVTETSGKTTRLRMFRIKSAFEQRNEFGDVVMDDMNKFWCELPNGELVKCQYFVFNPLLLGHVYFPMDMSAIKMSTNKPEESTVVSP